MRAARLLIASALLLVQWKANKSKRLNSHEMGGKVDAFWNLRVIWTNQLFIKTKWVFTLFPPQCSTSHSHTFTLPQTHTREQPTSIAAFYSELHRSNWGLECNKLKGTSALFEATAQRSSGQQSSLLVTRSKKDPEKGLEMHWVVGMMSKPW